jgi:hypothetical protein
MFHRFLNYYKNFFLHHENKIFIIFGCSGSIIGGHLGYKGDPLFQTKYMDTFMGTLAGGMTGLGTALLLEPIILPCATLSGSIYLVNKLVEK